MDMPAYFFQETNYILPDDFNLIDCKFHPTRLLIKYWRVGWTFLTTRLLER